MLQSPREEGRPLLPSRDLLLLRGWGLLRFAHYRTLASKATASPSSKRLPFLSDGSEPGGVPDRGSAGLRAEDLRASCHLFIQLAFLECACGTQGLVRVVKVKQTHSLPSGPHDAALLHPFPSLQPG